ncbi:MAG: hypothetical protein NCW75_10200 [Phycisphaera sp.]|nr:MAG: hypothetical protein NCW75_10200 [Phycisphaera sp.]
MVQMLAWRPLIDPIDAHAWWFMLLLPIALLVSLAWKAVRVDDIKRLPRPVIVMTVQVILAMLGLGLAAFVGLVVVLPILMDVAR